MFTLLRCLILGAVLVLGVAPALAQPEPPADGTPTTSIDAPDTPVGKQLAWVLAVINGKEIGDLTARFTPRFLEAFAPDEVIDTLTHLRERTFGGVRVDLVQLMEEESDNAVTGILNASKTERFLAAYVAIDEKSGKIAGLVFNPAGYSCAAGDWDSYSGDLGRLSGAVALGCYELVPADPASPAGDLRLVSIYEFGERRPHAVAGAMQLWVLGALGKRVASGKAAWDDLVPLKAGAMGIPGGELSSRPVGSEASLGELADRMSRAGDTTATDHLIAFLGADSIEDYVLAHTRDAKSSFPLLTLRQMFALKLDPQGEPAAAYLAAGRDERREMLAPGGALGKAAPPWRELETWDGPRLLDRAGYFCGAEDLCRILADLRRLEQKPGMERLLKPLRDDPGMKADPAMWTSVAHKSGTEPGALAMAWLMQRRDGRWFAMSAIWNNSEAAVSEDRLRDLARAGGEILAKYEPPADAPAVESAPAPTPSVPAATPK